VLLSRTSGAVFKKEWLMFIVILLGLTLLATVIKFQGASRLMNRLGKFIMIAGIYVVFLNKVVKALLFRHH
jgi:hypothetical protein